MHGASLHTSMDSNIKKAGHKYAANFFDKMERNENYFHTAAE